MSVSRNAGRSAARLANSFSSSVVLPCGSRLAASGRIETRPRRIVRGEWSDSSGLDCFESVMRAGCHPAPQRCHRDDRRHRRAEPGVRVRGTGFDPRPLWPTSRDEPDPPATCLEGALAMPPFIRPAQRGSRIVATALLVISIVAACDSSVTPTPSPASAAASTSVPSTPPASTSPDGSAVASTPAPATAQPVEPSPSAAAGLVPGALAVTVSDRLRVRSKPLVDASSALFTPVLPVGTQLQVIDGPTPGSGYDWVRVTPVGLTLDKGVARRLGGRRRPRRDAVGGARRRPAGRPRRRRRRRSIGRR